MRSNTEIEAEVNALKKALQNHERWNEKARDTINQSIRVLEQRMDEATIEATYYVDESADEFEEGDNDLYNEMMYVFYWLQEERGYDAPSLRL